MFTVNGNGTVSVYFFPHPNQAAQEVTVNIADALSFPTLAQLTYDVDANGSVEVWPQLMELAYGRSDCPALAGSPIMDGLSPEIVFPQLRGRPVTTLSPADAPAGCRD